MEAVKDCILLEHIGAFSVTTHVMLRLKANNSDRINNDGDCDERKKTKDESLPGLVSVFPDAELTFEQCHGLVNQIGRALNESL